MFDLFLDSLLDKLFQLLLSIGNPALLHCPGHASAQIVRYGFCFFCVQYLIIEQGVALLCLRMQRKSKMQKRKQQQDTQQGTMQPGVEKFM